jgi:hypothetical protein
MESSPDKILKQMVDGRVTRTQKQSLLAMHNIVCLLSCHFNISNGNRVSKHEAE